MKLQPYLCFEGRCEEAIEFYKRALNAEVVMCVRRSDTPDACAGGGADAPDKIAHAVLNIGGLEVCVSDGMNSGHAEFKGTTLSLSVDSDAEARRVFDALADSGQVLMDLDKTFFASQWGVCSDRFGVPWMVLVPVPVGV